MASAITPSIMPPAQIIAIRITIGRMAMPPMPMMPVSPMPIPRRVLVQLASRHEHHRTHPIG